MRFAFFPPLFFSFSVEAVLLGERLGFVIHQFSCSYKCDMCVSFSEVFFFFFFFSMSFYWASSLCVMSTRFEGD